MPEATCYILDGKQPVACNDMSTWLAFMNNQSKRTVAFDRVGTFEILTTFMGANIGTSESPKFFKMTIVGSNEGDPPICSGSWNRAEAKHKAAVRAASSLTRIAESGGVSSGPSFKFVGCEVLPNEVRFLLESEAVAIEATSKKIKNWFREGRTLIFRYKSSTDDCD